MVNQPSLRLIKSDLGYWQDEEGASAVFGTFIKDLKNIRSQLNVCQPNECILRLGGGPVPEIWPVLGISK
jgi:hypothetical protein